MNAINVVAAAEEDADGGHNDTERADVYDDDTHDDTLAGKFS